jgi:hypothetical protein
MTETLRYLSSGLRPRFNRISAGGSAPAPWVSFLCSCKEKKPKESTPPGLRPHTARVPSRRARLRGCADATSLSRRRTLAIPRSPLRARASASLGARLDQGVLKTPYQRFTLSNPDSRGFRAPVAAAEHRSRNREQRAACLSPRVRRSIHGSPVDFHAAERARRGSARPGCIAPGELGERPAEARRAGNRAQYARRSDRVSFSLVTFSWTSKRKSPRVQGRSHPQFAVECPRSGLDRN